MSESTKKRNADGEVKKDVTANDGDSDSRNQQKQHTTSSSYPPPTAVLNTTTSSIVKKTNQIRQFKRAKITRLSRDELKDLTNRIISILQVNGPQTLQNLVDTLHVNKVHVSLAPPTTFHKNGPFYRKLRRL